MKILGISTILFSFILSICSTGLTQHSKDEAVKNNNRFAFDMYKQIEEPGENVFFSPYSISSALAMTYTGAEGLTQKEMKVVFGFPDDKEAVGKAYQILNRHLDTLTDEETELNVANSLWCQEDYDFLEDFLSINKKYYDAGVRKVNFRKDHTGARKQINQWVENATKERIKNLIGEGMLDPSVRLVLANAIYFKGLWEFPFEKKQTQTDIFYAGKDYSKHVRFMNRSVSVKYFEDELAQVIELPYAGKELSMMILLPQETDGIKKLENKLDSALYRKYLDAMYTRKVDVYLPRFKVEAQYNLNDPMKNLGMRSAFDRRADFSGMTGKKDLFISDVAHKAFVEVTEEGTEAAAATGVVMSKTSLVKKLEFKADHPFIYMIRDNRTGAILFMGRLSDPGSKKM